jgi:transposase-like protein
MAMLPPKHTEIHHPKQDFGALCHCGSRNVIRDGMYYNRQYFKCNDCNEGWSIPVSKLQIMLKEYKVGLRDAIKNPRMGIEALGLKCIFCGGIDVIRSGIKNNKQCIKCNICHKYWRLPKLNVEYRLSKRNKKLVIQTV